MLIPPSFTEQVTGREGDEGRAWLATLPGLAEQYCRRWSLTSTGPAMHGYTALILPVTMADGTPAVLKLSWLDEETRDEPVALATWAGQGAVRLLDSDAAHGALLLERLDEHRMLQDEPIEEAVPIAARFLRRLAVPAPPLRRTLRDEAACWADELPAEWESLGRPMERSLLDAAVAICRERGPRAGTLLVNEDLHYLNVLRGTREPWLVIDPKPIAGDPGFGVIPMLWNRIDESGLADRFDTIVTTAELDHELAKDWTLVRAVLNWLWAVEDDEETGWLCQAVQRIARWARG